MWNDDRDDALANATEALRWVKNEIRAGLLTPVGGASVLLTNHPSHPVLVRLARHHHRRSIRRGPTEWTRKPLTTHTVCNHPKEKQ